MVAIAEITSYLADVLEAERFTDYCPNGLQVEGERPVHRLVSGVTASESFIDHALAADADALLVHHGYFWKGEPAPVTGMKARRIGKLLRSGVHLLAYHLPLDAHPVHGNNAQLAQRLGFEVEGSFPAGGVAGLGLYGTTRAASAEALAARIAEQLGREPVFVDGGNGAIRRVAWCSGAAQGFIGQAAELGVDAYISGEISEPTAHIAREMGIHYFAAGHHATERYGVQALGEHLAQRFGLEHRYVDVDNPA
ncbi:Nif3-like dinuclear metal center hexameric protein [Ectothiorhodospiraceae bacterium WFHF3C12]|nr:Nif3-like dinuclear metal center hexameric protein [Ectothiorhodospiraceae bacterium WFHF3C12]